MMLKCIANRGVQDSETKTSGWVKKNAGVISSRIEDQIIKRRRKRLFTANPIRFQIVDLPESV